LRNLLALATVVLVCGCSTVRFAYENADAYMWWKAGTYVDLEGAAAEELDDRIDQFHAWHRRHELPKYVKLAHEAAQRFADGLDTADLEWGYAATRAQTRESVRKGAELIAPLLDRLNAEQRAQIERRFGEDNRQFERNNLRGTERERRDRRTKNAVGRLEDWLGKLSPAQLQRVREYAERAPLLDEMRDRDRKRLQRDFVTIVAAREAQKRLPDRAADWDRGREPAYVDALKVWREHWFALLIDLDRSLSAEQRARAIAHLRRYADDFEALAAR
jgi:hypothetical protein